MKINNENHDSISEPAAAGLRAGNHVGGLAFGNGTVYIAGSTDQKVWKMRYAEVIKAVSAGKDVYLTTIPQNQYISTKEQNISASFVYWDDNYKELFVGKE